jgi:predicted DNA-binding protein
MEVAMTQYTTVRVSVETRDQLRALAEASGQSMSTVLREAVERLRRDRFLREVAASYAALREDPSAAAELDAEYHSWESTLGDGLSAEPPSDQPDEGPGAGRPLQDS